jgi:NCAIR mutase (PurE)-related protein
VKVDQIRDLLEKVRSGKIRVKEALENLKVLPYQDLGFAKIDTHRELRRNYPEIIFCPGKTPEQIAHIAEQMWENKSTVMAVRANREVYQAIKNSLPEARYYEKAKIAVLGERKEKVSSHTILVVSAGTADMPVAEEAAVTAEIMNNKVDRLYDVGVAGIHRLFDNKGKIFSANVLVVVAGMEGALPSVVGGLVSKPVIAVPTSVGYGASFKGVSALLAMLNSCAPGIAVVNIDNGFGAGYMASLINHMEREK